MPISLQTNVPSLSAQRRVAETENLLNSSLIKLSSGYRITKAGDDAAGLGISAALTAQIRSYNQAARNALDGLSLIETAEGALNETMNILTRLRELAMQSATSTVGNTERGYIQDEVDELLVELDRIANATEFNGRTLLNGTITSLTFQIGIRNVDANDRVTVGTANATSGALGVNTIDLSSQTGAQGALGLLDTALESVSSSRATLGAAANRLTAVERVIRQASESLSSANSRIRDVNVAEETSTLARAQILMQAGVSILAQANQLPTLALKLLA